jgi:hypothetical protein
VLDSCDKHRNEGRDYAELISQLPEAADIVTVLSMALEVGFESCSKTWTFPEMQKATPEVPPCRSV